MSVYNFAGIQKLIDDDRLDIEPRPTEERNEQASIDLRLGRWFEKIRDEYVDRVELNGRYQERTKTTFIDFGDSFILHANEAVVGITLEWVSLGSNVVAEVEGKSGIARLFLSIHQQAPIVHPGFTGCIALELKNLGKVPILLRPGSAICQIKFSDIEPWLENEGDGYVSPHANGRKPRI